MKRLLVVFLNIIILITITPTLFGQMETDNSDKLVVLWVSGDRDVAEKSCLMYTHAAKKYEWFSEVTLISWGPSAKLLAEDEAIREKVKSDKLSAFFSGVIFGLVLINMDYDQC